MTQNLRLVKDADLLILRERAKELLQQLNVDYFTIMGKYEFIIEPLKSKELDQATRAKIRALAQPLEDALEAHESKIVVQRQFCVAIHNELARREWLTTMDPRILEIVRSQQGIGRARGGKGKGEGGG